MFRNRDTIFLSVALTIIFFITGTVLAAESSSDLKNEIDEKAEALKEINIKLNQAQKNLDETEGESRTLSGEIKQTNYRINQLNLGIKSSEIQIDKLGLEIKSLGYDIGDIRVKTGLKKAGVAQLLREIQKKDDETLLAILLKSKSLAENLNEVEQLAALNQGLSNEVNDLQLLSADLSEKLDLDALKKRNLEQENKNLKSREIIAANQKIEKQKLLRETKNREKEYQELISDLEEQQEEIASEIEKLEIELRAKVDPEFLPVPRPGLLAHPLPGKKITQDYGATKFARYGYKGKWHNGLDFGAPIGTPILAAEDGEIVATGDQDNYRTNGKRLCYRGAYGKFVVIKHKNNLTTMYAHLSLISVKIGDKVEREQVIGYVGNTGYSTGPHLHFTVYSTQTIPSATPGFPEGTRSSRVCGPLPVGGDINPTQYLDLK